MSDNKTKEELDQIIAETKKIKAETRKLEAQALEAEYAAAIKKFDLDKRDKEFRRRAAADEEHMLYRFNTRVDKSHIYECMHILTRWSRRHPKCDMEIVFSSGGGSIIDGFILFDFIQDLRSRGHKITTGSLGMAASMAGVLLQAGDHRWMGHQAWMMIHRAAFGAIGKTFEIEDEVAWIKRIEDRILDIFEKRSKLTRTRIKRNWDRKDWWISSDEALDLGLIDEIKGEL